MTPLNTQRPEGRTAGDGNSLEIVGTPWLTLQGEGPLAGHPAVFVRLAGCNLKCPGCDTDYTSDRRTVGVEELATQVAGLAFTLKKAKPVVVVTGGEPFRQRLDQLVRLLAYNSGLLVQVETNGALPPVGFDSPMTGGFRPLVVVSPKLSVCDEIWKMARWAKYVLRAGFVGEDGLPTRALGYAAPPDRPPADWSGTVYVQPEDQQDETANAANRQAAVESAMTHNHTVSLQLHKILGVP